MTDEAYHNDPLSPFAGPADPDVERIEAALRAAREHWLTIMGNRNSANKAYHEDTAALRRLVERARGETAAGGDECERCDGRGWLGENSLDRLLEPCDECGGAGQVRTEAVGDEDAARLAWLRGRALEVSPPGRQYVDDDGAVQTIEVWTVSGFSDYEGEFGLADGETWEAAIDAARAMCAPDSEPPT